VVTDVDLDARITRLAIGSTEVLVTIDRDSLAGCGLQLGRVEPDSARGPAACHPAR
jgi:hypothetical protein